MTDHENKDQRPLENEKVVAELLRMAGPRPGIDVDRERRVYAAVLEAWQGRDGRPATTRVYGAVLQSWLRRNASPWRLRWVLPAAAATIALALAVSLVGPDTGRAVVVASITKVVIDETGPRRFQVGDTLTAQTMLVTGPAERLSVRLAGGQSLRVDAATELTLVDRHRIRLAAGRIYADTGNLVYRDAGLVVDTPFGEVRDIGTQFAVALESAQLDVAVREGRVDVHGPDAEHVAVAGERLRLAGDGRPERSELAPTAAFWDWATELAPDFDIENRSLLDLLKWVARETGMELVFSTNEARLAAMRTDLHGSIAGFTPFEALDSVIATTGFSYRIDGTRILIER